MSSPLFSIVTPCFNSEDTIERTIKSILQQKTENYEYIIVDGASTDHTLDIIKKYEPYFDGRMRWYSEPDRGIYDAFNKGVNYSRGIYCWNVNSDDYLEPDALYFLSGLIQKYNSSELPVISGSLNFFDEDTGRILYVEKLNEARAKRAFHLDQTCVTHPATIVPKYVYDKYGTFDSSYKLLGDTEWAHRVYASGTPFLFVDKVLTNMSNAGLTGNLGWKRFKLSHHDRKKYFKTFYKNPIERYARFLLWDLLFLRGVIKSKLKK